MQPLLVLDVLHLLVTGTVLFTLFVMAIALRRLFPFVGHVRHSLRRAGVPAWVAVTAAIGVVAGIAVTATVATGAVEGRFDATYVVGLSLFGGGAALVALAVSRRSEHALLAAARERDPGSVSAGETVRVSGTAALASATTRAPFSESECLAYDARTERRVDSIRFDASSWVVDDRVADAVPFDVTDETGAVRVEPSSDADGLRLDNGPSAASVTGSDAEPERRHVEHRVDPEDPVHVVGETETDVTGRTVVRGELLITDRDPRALGRRFRNDVRRNGPIGIGLAVVGVGLMLAAVR
jgi:hypothetical protein